MTDFDSIDLEDILSAGAYKKKKPWRFPFSTTFYKLLACNLTSAYSSKFCYATPIKTRKGWKPG